MPLSVRGSRFLCNRVLRPLVDLARVLFVFRGNYQFKANLIGALAAWRKRLLRLKAGPVGQAMFGV
jgi:hypothetical protein